MLNGILAVFNLQKPSAAYPLAVDPFSVADFGELVVSFVLPLFGVPATAVFQAMPAPPAECFSQIVE